MQRVTILFFSCILSLSLKAHDYYFAFAEIEINPFTGKIETTLMITTHDMEQALKDRGVIECEMLETCLSDSLLRQRVRSYINEHLYLTNGDFRSDWDIDGHESFLNGLTYIYLSSEGIIEMETIKVKFDLLMSVIPEQQNKITLYYKEKTYTQAFISNESYKQLNIIRE